MKLRILLTGGGTGGHIYPLMAVVRKLQELRNLSATGSEMEIRYFGDPGGYGELLQKNGIAVVRVAASKLRRYFDVRNFLDFFKFFIGFFEALWKVFWYMPDAAFSKGGPGALSVLLACRFYQVPVIVHESDTIPGVTNRASAKSSRLVLLAFPGAQAHFPPKCLFRVTGNPVREEELRTENDQVTSKKSFGFDPAVPLLLFLGGSQGAEAINDFVFENIVLLTRQFQVLHQVGRRNYEEYKNEYQFFSNKYSEEVKKRYVFVPYFEETMREALNAADLAVARAGAGTIFELAYAGKPAMLIPLPDAANNHQWENAIAYEKAGAALVITQENLKPQIFMDQAAKLLSDSARCRRMSESARKFYVPNSAKMIAEDILKIAEGR